MIELHDKTAREMSPQIKWELIEYENRVQNHYALGTMKFGQAISQFFAEGRELTAPPGDDNLPTFDRVSIMSDGSNYPMFPEEIRDFVMAVRMMHCCPQYGMMQYSFRGVCLMDMLAGSEMLALVTYMNEQEPGAGFITYGMRRIK